MRSHGPYLISPSSSLVSTLQPSSQKSRVRTALLLNDRGSEADVASSTSPAVFDGAKFWLKFLLITVWAWVSLSVLSDSVFKADYLDYFKYVSLAALSTLLAIQAEQPWILLTRFFVPHNRSSGLLSCSTLRNCACKR